MAALPFYILGLASESMATEVLSMLPNGAIIVHRCGIIALGGAKWTEQRTLSLAFCYEE
jgi:hypothetical protein